jgi:hypothetical protein
MSVVGLVQHLIPCKVHLIGYFALVLDYLNNVEGIASYGKTLVLSGNTKEGSIIVQLT